MAGFRDIHVRIIGDASSVKKAMKESGDAATDFNRKVGGVRQSMDDLVRVSSARGKGIGGFRLAGIGLTAGFAIAGTTRAIADLRDGLEVTGEEAETFTGRMRNVGASLLGGDFVGAFQAMTRETHNFTAAQVEAIAVTPQMIEMIKRMGDTAALSTAALASMDAMLVTPGRLQLGAARAKRTSSSLDDLASLDARIANLNQVIQKLKVQGALVTEEGEADKRLAAAITQVTALENEQAALLDRLRAAKQKTAAAAIAAFQASFLTGLKGLGLKADKALLTATLNDDIAASNEIIRLIQIQIQKEGRTFELENQLTQARLKRQGIIQTQQANAAAAAAASAAAAAAAQAERDRQVAEAERRAREAEERARKALEARRTARLGRQFTALGLTETGAQRVPGVGSLRRRLASLRRQVEGTVLDTPKTAAQLERISRVLSGRFGKVGRDVRSAILDMFRDITGALKDGAKETENATVTSFQKRGVGKILAGLGLSPREIKALRQRLAQGGVGGFAPRPGLGGAFGMGVGAGGNVIVNGNLVVQNPRDVDQFVKEVQRRGHRSSRVEAWDEAGCQPWTVLVGVLSVFNWQGLSLATGGTKFTVTPTWSRLDTVSDECRVASVEIRRGRSDEFERTDTGSCTVTFKDRDGSVDPTTHDWVSRPLAFAVRNPVTDTWHPRFRGHIEDHGYDLHPSRFVGEVVIEAADALSYFAGFELAPGLAGDPIPDTPAGRDIAGNVFYEDTAVTGPQIRINQALADANWPSGLTSIFTGNVNLHETVYSPGESILSVIHDAADAEFPGVANFYVDRYGVVCFHGRLARFNPSSVASSATHWDFHAWDLGEGGTQIGPPFFVRRSSAMIRNAAMCFPQYMERDTGEVVVFPSKLRDDQVVLDTGSIATHGVHSWSAENLATKEGITSSLSGPAECKTFAEYMVANYADPKTRLSQVTIRPVHPGDPRAPEIWNLLCNVDISDKVNLDMNHPGLGGVTQSFFVEGITERWEPLETDLDTGYPFCEMTLDLSPDAYWTTPP